MNSVNVENALVNERARIRTEIELVKTQIINHPDYVEERAAVTLGILDHIIKVVEKRVESEKVIQI